MQHRLSIGLVVVALACTGPEGRRPTPGPVRAAVVVDDGKGVQLEILKPYPSEIHALTTVKTGVALDIVGSAGGVSFRSYRLEWAPGRLLPQPWSSAGVVLEAGGATPVQNGLLARWTPPAAGVGEHSIRLVGSNGAEDTVASTVVYLEPDLVSAAWPQYIGNASSYFPVVPVRTADGKTWLALCGAKSETGTTCTGITADGSVRKNVALDSGSQHPPSAGDVDGLPGDEVVVTDQRKIRILTPDLQPVREILLPEFHDLGYYETFLADLDSDGVFEIISLVFVSGWGAELHVHRGNGQPFSARYPVTLAPIGPGCRRGVLRLWIVRGGRSRARSGRGAAGAAARRGGGCGPPLQGQGSATREWSGTSESLD